MYSIKQIYKSMNSAVAGICDKVYIQDRPLSIDERIKSYLLLEISSSIENQEMNSDGAYNLSILTVRFVLFVRNRTSAKNINAMDINELDKKFSSIMSIFPYSDDYVTITRPYILMSGNDGSDFHYIAINADLKIK